MKTRTSLLGSSTSTRSITARTSRPRFSGFRVSQTWFGDCRWTASEKGVAEAVKLELSIRKAKK
jgi:hypothetical protein